MVRLVFIVSFFVLMVILAIICNTTDHTIQNEVQQSRRSHLYDNWLYQGGDVGILAEQRLDLDKPYFKSLHIIVNRTPVWSSDSSTIFTNRNGVLPIVRDLKEAGTEILIGYSERFRQDKIILLTFFNEQLVRQDTLPMFDKNHQDMDKDGLIEFRGKLGYFPSYCRLCDSTYYNPELSYEMTDIGFILDSLETRRWIMQNYGEFHGYKASSEIVVPRLRPKE